MVFMNIKQGFNKGDDGEALYANDVMNTCMAEIHDMLMIPMHDKLNSQQHAVLMLVGITLKIIAEKATLYEQQQQGEPDQNHRN